jgi:RNA polymerase sigma-70 factor (ECF subfamily)
MVADLKDERVLWVGPASTQADDLIRIERAVRSLPDPFREAVILKYLQHLTYEEVADVLDCPVGTAKANVARGLERVRRAILEERHDV